MKRNGAGNKENEEKWRETERNEAWNEALAIFGFICKWRNEGG